MPDFETTDLGTTVERTPQALIMRGDPTQPRTFMPPAPPEDFGANISRVQSQVADLPLDQAEAAVNAAMRFQAQRGYQRDLQEGKPAAEAMARWAPMLFAGKGSGNLGQAANMIRATAPKPNYSFMPPAGGAPAYFGAPGARPVIVPPSATGQGKDIVPKLFTDPTTGKQHLYNPQTGAKWSEPADKMATVDVVMRDGTTVRGPLTDPAIQQAIRMNGQVSTNLLSAPVAAPRVAAPATTSANTGRVRVKGPDGRTGSVPASRLQEYLDAGYKRE